MSEILSYDFMQRAFIAGTATALFTGVISAFVVLRRISFLGSGISHAAFGGVAIGFLSGVNPLATALIYCIAVAFAIEIISTRGRLAEDAAIGIFFSGSMAMGVVLISLSKSYTVDLFGYLFGSILAIGPQEMYMAVAMVAAGMTVFVLIVRDLLFITFNEELAIINGIPVRLIKAVFLLAMSVAIVIGIKIVGIVLISALLVIPGATAKLLTQRFYWMLVISSLVAVTATILGLIVSYVYDLASGGTIVLTLAAFFGIAFIMRRRG